MRQSHGPTLEWSLGQMLTRARNSIAERIPTGVEVESLTTRQDSKYEIKPMRNGGYRIDQYRYRGGPRVRRRFQTIEEAREARTELLEQDKDRTARRAPKTTWLKAQQLRDAEAAYLCLGQAFSDERWPLCRAVHIARKEIKCATRHHPEVTEETKEVQSPKTISRLLPRFLETKQTAGCRPETVGNYRSRIGLLWRHLGDPLPSDVTRKNVDDFLNRQSDPTTQDNDRRAISAFFSWCREQDPPLCSENPATKKRRGRRPTSDEKEPVILTLGQVWRLLSAGAAFNNGELIPYLILCLFCALRPREVSRLLIGHVSMKHKAISIPSVIAKLRQRRVVEIPPVAMAWLRPYLKPNVPLYPRNWRKKFDEVKRMAGFGTPSEAEPNLTPWPQNALRHTAITHRFSATGDEKTTASWAGTSPEMVHAHYKGLVWPSDSKAFWRLTPHKVLKRKSARGRS